MNYLLDVNVLLALGFAEHIHHARARTWMNGLQRESIAPRFATCAIVELGFVRIAANHGTFSNNVADAQTGND